MKKFIILALASTLMFASTSAASQRDPLIQKIDQSIASQTYAQQVKTREGIKSKIISAASKTKDTSKFESILDAVNDHVAELKKNLENNQTSVKGLLYQQIREGVLNKTNEIRLGLDLQPLKLDDTLSLIAELYVGYIDRTDDFSHTTEGGVTFEDRIKTSGYPFALAGENLAKGYTDTDAVMKAWMESPAHKDNIVNPNFRDMGLAYKNGYRVQVFGIKTIQD